MGSRGRGVSGRFGTGRSAPAASEPVIRSILFGYGFSVCRLPVPATGCGADRRKMPAYPESMTPFAAKALMSVERSQPGPIRISGSGHSRFSVRMASNRLRISGEGIVVKDVAKRLHSWTTPSGRTNTSSVGTRPPPHRWNPASCSHHVPYIPSNPPGRGFAEMDDPINGKPEFR